MCKTQKANQQMESDTIKTILKTVDYSPHITVQYYLMNTWYEKYRERRQDVRGQKNNNVVSKMDLNYLNYLKK